MQLAKHGTFINTVALATLLVACNGATETSGEAEATVESADEGAAVETDGDASVEEVADGEDVDDGEDVSGEEEVDARVDPDRLVTTITFSGDEYDIRDVRCDDFGGDWQIHGYIDTVHRGGDSITVHDREIMGGVYVELTILDEETDEEVTWATDQVDGLDVDATMEGGASGTIEVELDDRSVRDIGDREPESLELDLHCDQAL